MNHYQIIILLYTIICILLVYYICLLEKDYKDLLHSYIDSTMADTMNKKQTEKGENR